MADESFDFSGDAPEDVQTLLTDSEVDPGLLSNGTVVNELITSTVTFVLENTTTTTTTTSAPTFSDYHANPFRVGFLGFKCVLIILLLAVSCTIRRDFLKFFVLFLIIPLFIEAGFDIFTEIHASTAIFGTQGFDWEYLNLPRFADGTVTDWQKHAIESFGQILQKYTTYQLYTQDQLFSTVSYVADDFFFWNLLFSTTNVFYYAHKAVTHPEQITYAPIGRSFLKIQILPILFTAIDTLLSLYTVPQWVYLSVMFLVRIAACTLAFMILTQAFASFILFCRRKDEVTKTSPYEHVRNSKLRLFLFMLFTVLVHALSAPYIIWSGLTIADDVGHILGFDWYLPMHFASELFPLHLTLFLVRPFAFLILCFLFLNPYRRRFVKIFCSCCRRH